MIALLSSAQGSAAEKVISNSADWKDVYSSMLYASLIGKQPGLFLTSSKHGSVLLYSVPKSLSDIVIFSSRSQPYIVNYKTVMEGQGYEGVEEVVSNTINMDIARRLYSEKNIRKFIIVDDAYGYNALSVASYAVIDNYYVIFANARNIAQVDSFLNDVDPEKIILFGQVDEVVKTRLANYNPEIINTGDRFDNNIEMVKKYQNIKRAKQVLMSNGEFIEASIMSGQDPVLFIGKSAVPSQVQEYIKKSEFQVAVLIGNELINSATTVRRQIGISVFVKFAQGARKPEGSISAVEDLDKFIMPRYALDLEIYSVLYNKATRSLWVTYKNKVNLGMFLKSTITLSSDGQLIGVAGDDLIFIDKNQYKTVIYDRFADDSPIILDGENITAKFYTLFGEGKKSLENVLEGTAKIDIVEILDDSLINITDVSYDKRKGTFIVTITNNGLVDSYVSLELLDLYINGEYIIVSSPEPIFVQVGKTVKILVPVELSDIDISNNPHIKVKAYYGQRENSLIKTIYAEYMFKYVRFDIVFYALILLVLFLILLILFGRKRCPTCKTLNSRTRKHCKKCGHALYKRK
jgi:archaellum component FlaF (FlaF/FlaG flagellin family)